MQLFFIELEIETTDNDLDEKRKETKEDSDFEKQ